MPETKRCPRCQAEIPAGAPEGLCPQCLLQAGLESKTAQPDPHTAAYTPDGSAFVPPTVESLQSAFPQLEILELLGKGGMGAVYKAKQHGLDRLVAVKILSPQLSQDPAFAERFLREAKALARLSHPNIVGVHDVGQAGGYCYFIMEFVDGVNLRQAMRAGELKPAEALKIVPQICDALQFAHDEGIVHRDIKPENILLDKKGRVKIADFGLAKLLGKTAPDVSLTGTQQVMGTMHYMAPEQFAGSRDIDHRADIYSLGVTFYEMLTGELPIGRFAAPSKMVQIDVRLDEVVLRSLEKAPEQRYQHASEIRTDMELISRGIIAGGEPEVATAASPSKNIQAVTDTIAFSIGFFCLLMLANFVLSYVIPERAIPGALIGVFFILLYGYGLARRGMWLQPAIVAACLVVAAAGLAPIVHKNKPFWGLQGTQFEREPFRIDVVEQDSPAQTAGLRVNDKILAVNGVPDAAARVQSGPVEWAALHAALDTLRPNETATLWIMRNHRVAEGLVIGNEQTDVTVTGTDPPIAMIYYATVWHPIAGGLGLALVLFVFAAPTIRSHWRGAVVSIGGFALVAAFFAAFLSEGPLPGVQVRRFHTLNWGEKLHFHQTWVGLAAALALTALGVMEMRRSGPIASGTTPVPDADSSRRTNILIDRTADSLLLWAAITLVTGLGALAWVIFVGVPQRRAPDETFWGPAWQHPINGNLFGMGACLLAIGVTIGLAAILLRRLRWRMPVLILVVLFGLFAPAVFVVNVVLELERIPTWPVLLPLWLGMPLAVWTVYLLFREDVRLLFQNQKSAAGQQSMWLGIAEWQRGLIKTILVFGLLGCAGIFLFFDNVTHFRHDNPAEWESFNRPYQHVEVGAFDPWLILDRPHLETKRNVTEVRWLSGSMAAGVMGLLVLIALVIIRGLETSSDLTNALATARRAVQAPADGSLLAACVSLLAAALMVFFGIDWNAGTPANPDFPPAYRPPTAAMMNLAAAYVFSAVAQLTIGIQMRRLQGRTVLLLACFLILSIQCVYTGLVFGQVTGLKGWTLMPFALTVPLTLWATITLFRRDVQAAFDRAEETPTADQSAPDPAGPPQTIRQFQTNDSTIITDGVTIAEDAWLIDVQRPQTIRLFEVPDPGAEQCVVTYRAKIKTEGLSGRAYLEMWCRFPGRGEFFSKGLHQTVSGTTDWASFEIPFLLKKGERPDLVKLNLVVEGIGKVWLKDIELLKTPMGS